MVQSLLRQVATLIIVNPFLQVVVGGGDLRAQQVVYDHFVKVTLPPGWIEKRAWEETSKQALPFYSARLEGVAFVHGWEKPDPKSAPEEVKGLGEGGTLTEVLGTFLKNWPGEASRFHAVVSGGPAGFTRSGQARYLGRVKVGPAELELAEWLSNDAVDGKFATQFKLRPEFVGSKAQIVFGSLVFNLAGGGYTLAACRFSASQGEIDWIKPLIEGITPVPESERSQAEKQGRIRDLVREALSSAQALKYAEALVPLRQALELAPQDENALDVQGAVLLQQQNLAQAETILRQATAINPHQENARFNLATALLYLGKKAESIKEFEAARQISPLYPQIETILSSLR
jgi:hypothetical protein